MCGVKGFPATITRCLGVTGTFLDSASRCRGVFGVATCIGFAFSSAEGQHSLIIRLVIYLRERSFEILNCVLILVGDRAIRPPGVVCLAGTDACLDDLLGVMTGSASSSTSRISMSCVALRTLLVTNGFSFSSLTIELRVRLLTRALMAGDAESLELAESRGRNDSRIVITCRVGCFFSETLAQHGRGHDGKTLAALSWGKGSLVVVEGSIVVCEGVRCVMEVAVLLAARRERVE